MGLTSLHIEVRTGAATEPLLLSLSSHASIVAAAGAIINVLTECAARVPVGVVASNAAWLSVLSVQPSEPISYSVCFVLQLPECSHFSDRSHQVHGLTDQMFGGACASPVLVSAAVQQLLPRTDPSLLWRALADAPAPVAECATDAWAACHAESPFPAPASPAVACAALATAQADSSVPAMLAAFSLLPYACSSTADPAAARAAASKAVRLALGLLKPSFLTPPLLMALAGGEGEPAVVALPVPALDSLSAAPFLLLPSELAELAAAARCASVAVASDESAPTADSLRAAAVLAVVVATRVVAVPTVLTAAVELFQSLLAAVVSDEHLDTASIAATVAALAALPCLCGIVASGAAWRLVQAALRIARADGVRAPLRRGAFWAVACAVRLVRARLDDAAALARWAQESSLAESALAGAAGWALESGAAAQCAASACCIRIAAVCGASAVRLFGLCTCAGADVLTDRCLCLSSAAQCASVHGSSFRDPCYPRCTAPLFVWLFPAVPYLFVRCWTAPPPSARSRFTRR
jgi:hypothetical protein